jgi:predicted glycosyltransferase involved in capsule biosynthesis
MRKKLSIVVPYRNREEHLKKFVPHMESYLKKDNIPFHIYIIHQADEKPFNRAKLLNVGFKESEEFDYFIFHDVDMLPMDSDYSYVDCPTHLASKTEQFGWRLPYDGYFGGVTAFDKENFVKINGYSNDYWGWGAEDDDVMLRCVLNGIPTSRKSGRYRSLAHERNIVKDLYEENLKKYFSFNSPEGQKNAENKINSDGLTTLKYEILEERRISDKTRLIKVKI